MNQVMHMVTSYETRDGDSRFFVEQLPDYVLLAPPIADTNGVILKTTTEGDGLVCTMTFANGVAVYELKERETGGYIGKLRTWTPCDWERWT